MMLSYNNEHDGEVCGNTHSEIASSRRGPWGVPVQRAMRRPCALHMEIARVPCVLAKLIFECPMPF